MNEILNLWGIVCRLFFKCNPLFIFWTASWLLTNFGPFSRDNLTNSMLITAFYWYRPKCYQVSKGSWVPKPIRATNICQIICQGESQHEKWTWSDLWNLLIIAIKLKDKYFHNSLDWSGLFLHVCYLTATESLF